MWGYTLEVVEFPREPGCEKHIGYMNIVFKTKRQAVRYYDAWNPHLRSIQIGYSDWDPKTFRRYIIREDFVCLEKTVDPFGGEADAPVVVGVTTVYKHWSQLRKNFPNFDLPSGDCDWLKTFPSNFSAHIQD